MGMLPLFDQAVVREQARMVLPAHWPRLPCCSPPLMQRSDDPSRPCIVISRALVAEVMNNEFLACSPHLRVHAWGCSHSGRDAIDCGFLGASTCIATNIAGTDLRSGPQ